MVEQAHVDVVEELRKEAEGGIIKSFEIAREIIRLTPVEEINQSLMRTYEGKLSSSLSVEYPTPPIDMKHKSHDVLYGITLMVPVNHDETSLEIRMGVDDDSPLFGALSSSYSSRDYVLAMGVDQSNPRAYGSGRVGETSGSIVRTFQYELERKLRELQEPKQSSPQSPRRGFLGFRRR